MHTRITVAAALALATGTVGASRAVAQSGAAPAAKAAEAPKAAEAAEAPEAAAQQAAEAWLRLIDGAQYAASWDSAAASFQRAIPRAAWPDAVRGARQPLEPFGPRTVLRAY